MKQRRCFQGKLFLATVGLGIACSTQAMAGKKAKPAPPPDRIEVIAHLQLDGKPQQNLFIADHWRKQYLYMQSTEGHSTTVIDVSSASSPKQVQQIASSSPGDQLFDVVGTAVLETGGDTPRQPEKPTRTVSITSFADPEKPLVTQRFTNVTDVLRDQQRGLIYLVNNEGLYILQERPATDQKLQDEYGAYVLSNR